MKKLSIFLLLTFISISIAFSCQRISTDEKGELKSVQLSNLKGVPLEYGELISVTTHAAYPGMAQLWFEDDDRIIRMVRIGFDDNKVREQVIVLPRY